MTYTNYKLYLQQHTATLNKYEIMIQIVYYFLNFCKNRNYDKYTTQISAGYYWPLDTGKSNNKHQSYMYL